MFLVSAFLLLTMGGAIVAAPLTVPLMFLAVRRRRTRGFRIAGAVLGSLTIAEVVWAIVYLAWEDTQPWIWLLPLVAAIAVGAAFVVGSRPPRHRAVATV